MTLPGRDDQPSAGERPKTRAKQALIRPDQQTSLDDLARSLHDARGVKGERITANTLLRVAIDGLVEHGDHLYGDNEVQLLVSWRQFLTLATSLEASEPALSGVAKDIGDTQGGEGDPITIGALVRIAVTGFAAHRRELHGATEAELLTSWLTFLGEREATVVS